MSVDFPAPFSPTIPCTVPRATSIETLSSAFTPGNDLLTSFMERMIPESFVSTRIFPFQFYSAPAFCIRFSLASTIFKRGLPLLQTTVEGCPALKKSRADLPKLGLAQIYHSGYGRVSTLSLVTTSSGMKLIASKAWPSSLAFAHSRLLIAMLVKLCPMETACVPALTWS